MSSNETLRLEAIRNALKASPHCSGTWSVDTSDMILYYKNDGGVARRMDLAHTQPDGIDQLLNACESATFVRNGEEVMDESYQKARKLDADRLLVKFDPVKSGLVQAVCNTLSQGHLDIHTVETEITELKSTVRALLLFVVQVPEFATETGSFFKAHRPSPRSQRVFGSLVIVFPVLHRGGSLVVRHQSREWSFDSDAELKDQSNPRVGYTAFYNDVEREIMPVISGHSVTVTYTLLNAVSPQQRGAEVAETGDKAFLVEALQAIRDPSFFPDGTTLGFGLSYKYPVSTVDDLGMFDTLRGFESRLKGTDAFLLDALKALNVNPFIRVVYKTSVDYYYLCEHVVYLRTDYEIDEGSGLEDQILGYINNNGFKIAEPQIYGESNSADDDEDEDEEEEVSWVTLPMVYNRSEDPYVSYGNEACLQYLYHDFCLIVSIEEAEMRMAKGVVSKDVGESWLESLDDIEKGYRLKAKERCEAVVKKEKQRGTKREAGEGEERRQQWKKIRIGFF